LLIFAISAPPYIYRVASLLYFFPLEFLAGSLNLLASKNFSILKVYILKLIYLNTTFKNSISIY
jgi:hypothetical protein